MSLNPFSSQNPVEEARLPSQRLSAEHPILKLLLTLIIAASLLKLTYVPYSVYVLTAVPAVFSFGLLAIRHQGAIEIPTYALVAYAAIWALYLPHAVLPEPTTFALVRLPVFMASSFILLFVAPQTVEIDHFFATVFYLSVGLALIGIPTLFLGEYRILTLLVSGHPVPGEIPLLGYTIQPLKSLMANPNTFGKLAGFGALAGLSVYISKRRRIDLALLLLLIGCLFFSFSRGAQLGFLTGLTLFSVYRYAGRKYVYPIVVAGVSVAIYFTLAMIGFVPDYAGARDLFMYSRLEFWTAAVEALSDNMLFGIGFQPLEGVIGTNNIHSHYMFVLLTRGTVGAVIHLAFLGLVYRQRLAGMRDAKSAAILAMLTMLLIVNVFDSSALFGFAMNAVLPSLIVGYSLRTD